MATHAPTHGHPQLARAPRRPAPALLLVEALRRLVGRLGPLRVRPRLAAAQPLRPHAHVERRGLHHRRGRPRHHRLPDRHRLLRLVVELDARPQGRLPRPLDARRHQLARLLQGQHGPQGHRDPVPGDRVLLLRDRRHLRRARPRRAGHAGRDDRRRADLQRALQRPRDADDLPVRHPGLRRPRELRAADHDRREGHGVPAAERAVGVDAHPRRPDDGRRRRSSAPSTPAGPPTRRSRSRAAPARRCSRSASRWSAPARSPRRSTSWSRSSPCARRA